jgi:hypothetical protein
MHNPHIPKSSPRNAPDELTLVQSFSGGGELMSHNPHIPA